MNVQGPYTFNAPATKVWDLLIAPETVAQCLPGCEKLEPLGDDRYQATLKIGIAAISGRYQGTVALMDRQPPNSYRLLVDGSGTPGFVKGESAIVVIEQGEKMLVQVRGEIQVGGLVARVGQQRLGDACKIWTHSSPACRRRP